ncbi:putative F-box/LRR-repeat protein At3g18150 [Lycium ferocissimum]|uniref:putative F-box/LRR-repeat protein At3g18150 n=1 Tax=Lycium ferocissimum TaxID=112874 RepID=UPI002814B3F8|nr:putative F-box/LRR-repeat protein At3g18150 [Lycium ferocissimum]
MSSSDSTKYDGHPLTKKQKVTEVEETLDDRISELPESLLVQILSLLRIHDAIKTCILSKRWRYLWTSLDNFMFHSEDFLKTENSPSFVEHVFGIDRAIEWKSLKSIMLFSSVISDADLVNLLSGCPALETMKLSLFYGFGRHLEISEHLYDLRCKLVDVSSVVKAKLTFNTKCIKDIHRGVEVDDEEDSCRVYHQVFRTLVQDYLQKLSYATELTIGTWFIEVLCVLQFKWVPNPELKCKYLTLKLDIKKFNLYGVAGLLRASSLVETLSIDMETTLSDNSLCCELRYLAKGGNIDLQSLISSFVLPNLKKIKIVISFEVLLQFTGPLHLDFCLKDHSKWGFEKLFKLPEFLLKAATVLEKFVIVSKGIKCKTCSTNCVSLYLSRLSEKLLGCPRSSADSVIIFQE